MSATPPPSITLLGWEKMMKLSLIAPFIQNNNNTKRNGCRLHLVVVGRYLSTSSSQVSFPFSNTIKESFPQFFLCERRFVRHNIIMYIYLEKVEAEEMGKMEEGKAIFTLEWMHTHNVTGEKERDDDNDTIFIWPGFWSRCLSKSQQMYCSRDIVVTLVSSGSALVFIILYNTATTENIT